MKKNPFLIFLSLFTLKHSTVRLIRRIIIVGLGSLIIGIVVNQLMERGIPWRILLLSLPIGSEQSGWEYISTDSAFMALSEENTRFVDVRSPDEFKIDHIPGAVSLPFFDFFQNPSTFHTDGNGSLLILYDAERNSRNVRLIARLLHKEGFEKINVIHGALAEWLYMGYLMETGEPE